MTALERNLSLKIRAHEGQWKAATPGFHLQVYVRGVLKADMLVGETYPFYDLASLTKILFTASACMRGVEEGWLDLDKSVHSYWPQWKAHGPTLRQLMTHMAGLPWWVPLYKGFKGSLAPQSRWKQAEKLLLKLQKEMKSSTKAVYSDPDLWILAEVLVKQRRQGLLDLWQDLVDRGLMGQLHFNIANKQLRPKSLYAPTEECPWRKKVLQGEVHDDNAWALGGVAPHAGLFGRAKDVGQWALQLRKSLSGDRSKLCSEDVARKFVSRQLLRSQGDFGLLFMKPSLTASSAGRLMSKKSFGHTGFTGTSLWVDPARDVIVVLLSNRIAKGGRENQEFRALRPKVHNWVMESIT